MTIADIFSLQYTMDKAESVRRFLDGRRPEQVAPALDEVIRAAIELGEYLPDAWRRTFRSLDRCKEAWMTVQQNEDQRNAVLRLFTTVRQTMDDARRAAEAAQARTGAAPAELPRLVALIEDTRRQQEELYRDWSSFRDPLPPPDFVKAIPVEDAFAEMMGITVEQLREKVAEHKRRHYRDLL